MVVASKSPTLGNCGEICQTQVTMWKNRNQTEEEFNEMAMTNLYANYYLDQDKKDK